MIESCFDKGITAAAVAETSTNYSVLK